MSDVSTPVAAAARPRLQVARLRDLALLPAIVVLLIVGFIASPIFLTTGNLLDVVQQQSELGLVVLGEALVLIIGKMDLSLESTLGFAPALAMVLVLPTADHGLGLGLPEWTALPVCLLAGVLVGAINAFLVLRLQLSGFIITLGMLITVRGVQQGLTVGQSLSASVPSLAYLGNATWFGLHASIWIFLVVFAVAIVFVGYFRHGRSLYAIGGNEAAAKAAGIRTTRVAVVVIILASVLAALAGAMMYGRLGSVSASQGNGWIFDAFAAAVLGGVSLNGGKGTLFGALCGVLCLGLVLNILTLAHANPYWFLAIRGAIILGALVLARLTTGKAQD
ncbi:ABC transporter permease [Kutzneria chonburiensis]|uniref:ABC transporter permease n=1 Tax=Kutzneria chonburiensis TaxID=1483604 RepID=A0ABV6N2L5_9PSEU|nr:ABC transporter permease [Kutzneria chonburiensis]